MPHIIDGYDPGALARANAATHKLYVFNFERSEMERLIPKPPVLYHYTTDAGLKGIIEQNALWATSAYFLNDSTEINYGLKVFREAFLEWAGKADEREHPMFIGLMRDVDKSFEERLSDHVLTGQVYLACFCERDNLLSQWRAYGERGYSCGFRSDGKIKAEPKSIQLCGLRYSTTARNKFAASKVSSIRYSIFSPAQIFRTQCRL